MAFHVEEVVVTMDLQEQSSTSDFPRFENKQIDLIGPLKIAKLQTNQSNTNHVILFPSASRSSTYVFVAVNQQDTAV
jgi:hypothetical protein